MMPYRKPNLAKMPPAVLHENGDITICLPIPIQAIGPNASRGQSRKAALRKSRAVREHKTLARLMMKDALVVLGVEKPLFSGYSLAFYFRTAAFRDDDNADASCKAYRDGIAAALGIDDRGFRKLALSTHAKDAACARVEIRIIFGNARAMTPAKDQANEK